MTSREPKYKEIKKRHGRIMKLMGELGLKKFLEALIHICSTVKRKSLKLQRSKEKKVDILSTSPQCLRQTFLAIQYLVSLKIRKQ